MNYYETLFDCQWLFTYGSRQVNEFLAGAGTDAPDVEENITSRPSMSYDDMWAKTLLETTELGVSSFIPFM